MAFDWYAINATPGCTVARGVAITPRGGLTTVRSLERSRLPIARLPTFATSLSFAWVSLLQWVRQMALRRYLGRSPKMPKLCFAVLAVANELERGPIRG